MQIVEKLKNGKLKCIKGEDEMTLGEAIEYVQKYNNNQPVTVEANERYELIVLM